MSKRHEERALKLHARLTDGLRMHGGTGPKKYMTAEVDRLSVTLDPKGGISVYFAYNDGTDSRIEFGPEAGIYDMAREAKKHARGRCSEIREARYEAEKAAADRGDVLTGDAADKALADLQTAIEEDGGDVVLRALVKEAPVAPLKDRIAEILVSHRPSAEYAAGKDRVTSTQCQACGFVASGMMRTHQFADHQADLIAALI